LENTDWTVESETFIQSVEEALVYLSIPGGTEAIRLKEPSSLNAGLTEECVQLGTEGGATVTVLGFYSSCNNKPHRF
jgi:hypothetical protein